MLNEYDEVRFSEYCIVCKYKDLNPTDEPCNECLSNPINLHSRKPVNFEEDKK